MKIAIIGPIVEDVSLAELIISKMRSQGVDISTIKEAYIEVEDIAQKEDIIFQLENVGKDYIERLEAVEKFSKIKDRSYSTKFKEAGENCGKNNKSRRKM